MPLARLFPSPPSIARSARLRGAIAWAPALGAALATLALAFAGGCRSEGAADPPPAAVERPADAVSHTFRFHARVGERPFGCADTYTLHGVQVQPLDFRLLVSEFEILTADGRAVPVQLDEVDGWQADGVAMLDFENGAGSCANGTPEVRMEVTGFSEPVEVHGVRFTLGVPFERNHVDPARARGPLSQTAMHWGWQAGYKFLLSGFQVGPARWQLHLGSAGCEGTMTNVTGCSHPNRARVELAAFDPVSRSIPLQLETMFPPEAVQDGADREMRNGCMGVIGDPGCEQPYRAWGVDEAGEPALARPPFIGLR